MFVVLGGIGNLRGSVIAAAVLTVLPELLRSMNDYRMLIYAIVLIVVMIFNQSPEMIALRKRLTARFRKEDAEGKGAKDKEKRGWRKWHCWRSVTWVLRSAACRPLRSSIFPLKGSSVRPDRPQRRGQDDGL